MSKLFDNAVGYFRKLYFDNNSVGNVGRSVSAIGTVMLTGILQRPVSSIQSDRSKSIQLHCFVEI